MIKELVNFIDEMPEEVFSYNLSLDEGLYIFIDLDNNGNVQGLVSGIYKKDTERDLFFDQCLELQTKVIPVAPSKIFNPIKKIFGGSCSGFALCFNKKNLYKDKVLRIDEIKDSLAEYFKSAEKYILQENENHFMWFSKFKTFCCSNLLLFLQELPDYISLKENNSVNIFLKGPSAIDFQIVYDIYVANNVFNKDDYKTELDNVVYNIADSLSSFSEKKMFWRHKTAPFEFNYKISGDNAKKIWQFFNIRGRVLPNPLPIFIDKKELNTDVIRLVNEDKKIGYSEIIRKIYDEKKIDLGNYYILFFQKGDLIDLDFVPSFQYELSNMVIVEAFSLGEKQAKKIENLFDFEIYVANKIFNGQLVNKTKAGSLWLKYFGDIEYNPKYLSDNTFNQLLKYRKSFYDYIYKSKREAIQSFMFHDIMIKGVLDDIRIDEYKDRNHTKDYVIKEKLNIWFSLYYYFDSTNKSQNNMINKTQELSNRIKQIANSEYENIKNDEEFAFAAGQLIRYLLGQSETGERTHALLEPFLQKTDSNQFKLSIARTFEMYKHSISFYKGNTRYAFDKIMSQVMGVEPEYTNIKDLLPLILAGYFAETVFKKQTEQ